MLVRRFDLTAFALSEKNDIFYKAINSQIFVILNVTYEYTFTCALCKL